MPSNLCGKDVAQVYPAEALDLETLTAQQVTDLWPDASGETEAHEHGCPVTLGLPVINFWSCYHE